MNLAKYRVKPGRAVDLADWDPDDTSGHKHGKEVGGKELLRLRERLGQLQGLLYAEYKHKLLVVLQGMDTSGKDGTIRHVFQGVNPQGVRVVRFQQPTRVELERDYLWRVHQQAPGNGELAIFNRSHYEDVLVVRVHELVPREIWKRRYQQICDFERMLAEEGTTILKFFLHISREEQKQRLQARLNDPEKRWKFDMTDIKERELWPQYVKAYEAALEKTTTEWAPWHVVPANHKWYRNLVVSATIVQALEGLKMKYPKVKVDLEHLHIK